MLYITVASLFLFFILLYYLSLVFALDLFGYVAACMIRKVGAYCAGLLERN